MNSKIEYWIVDGYDEMDFVKVTAMLKGTYWCNGIREAEVLASARNSALLVGAFTKDSNQVGYARVISDKTRFAYILDVIVDECCRRQGVGQAMIKCILNHPDLKDVYQWLLVTRDAHGVYQKFGFNPVSRPDDWMEIRHVRPDR
jgi:ribosomal protein S18 acetylase RimI-like enzyme